MLSVDAGHNNMPYAQCDANVALFLDSLQQQPAKEQPRATDESKSQATHSDPHEDEEEDDKEK